MRSSAWPVSLLVGASFLFGCAKPGPTPEEQKSADEKRDRELQAEIARTHEPYQRAIEAFLRETSSGNFEPAYEKLAPVYTNMVTKEAFVERVKTNKNFQKLVEVKVLRTSAQAGTTRARCILGELGLAEVVFSTTSGTPKISSIEIGGVQALPSPP